jgi:hypothetical protein
MNRPKALYRGWGIPCAGTQVYAARSREEWLSKIPHAGVRRAELLYQQLDGLQALGREVRPEFLAESRKHKAAKLLRATKRGYKSKSIEKKRKTESLNCRFDDLRRTAVTRFQKQVFPTPT